MSEQEWVLRQIVREAVRCCPRCQHPFAEADVQLAGREEEHWIFALHCHACHTLTLLGLSLVAEAELFPRGASPTPQARPISVDDVLDMHLFLRDSRDLPLP